MDFVVTHDERVIVTIPETLAQIRLTPPVLRLLQACNGLRDFAALTELLAPGTSDDLPLLLAKFERLGLLVPYRGHNSTAIVPLHLPRASTTNREHPSRLRYRPPGTIEFAILNSQNWIERLKAPTDLVMTWPAQVIIWLVSLGGLVSWAADGNSFIHDLSYPVTFKGAAFGSILLVVCIFLHELSHAGALASRGGRVRRLGFMLLYGSPAMYCDISDAWRLPRAQRVSVALVGIRVHLLATGIGGLVASLTTHGTLHDTAVIVAGSNAVMAVINLCPLVKFDGYLALIGWLDVPNLRGTCMRKSSAALRFIFFGGNRPERIASKQIMFGIGSAVMGPVLVLFAVLAYQSVILATLGAYGAVLVLAAYSLGFYLLFGRFIRATISAVANGASFARVAVVCGTLVAFAVVALTTVQIPVRTSTVFYSEGSSLYVVIPVSVPSQKILIGQQIVLRTPGIFLRPVLGTGRVCSRPTSSAVPVDVGSSILFSTTVTAVHRVARICTAQAPRRSSGLAEISRGTSSLGYWLRTVVIEPSIAPFHADQI